MKRIVVLGSTGSIGTQTLDVARRHGDKLEVVALAAGTRAEELLAQAREFVDRRKQEKLRTTAQLYLAEHPTQLQPRFDVVEIYAPQGLATRAPEIYVIPDAF